MVINLGDKMLRVLHVFHEMANGGVEHFVMNCYRNIDREKLQFDFLLSSDYQGYFDQEIKALGGKVYYAYPLKKNPIRTYFDIVRIVLENNYQIIHRHTGNAFGYFELFAAKRGGAKHLIMHSHNPQVGFPLLHYVSKAIFHTKCEKFACSCESGQFLFGSKSEFIIIPNPINCEEFAFSQIKREKIRKEYELSGKFVIGHVGRFEKQKNHVKLLGVFSEILKTKDNAILMCIGEGSLLSEIEKLASDLNIRERVIFTGTRNNIDEIMNAFDIFLFPSIYEGFGIVQIEAQANGLKCFSSKDVIPDESNITGNITFISLDESNRIWADRILNENCERDLMAIKKIENSKYDVKYTTKELVQYYFSLCSEEVL